MKTSMLLKASLLCFLLSAGCGEESKRASALADADKEPPKAAKGGEQKPAPPAEPETYGGKTTITGGTLSAAGGFIEKNAGRAAANEPIERKIIQTATLDVLVSDFDKSSAELTRMIGDCKGYIVKSDFNGNIGAKRTGTWTIRVPVDRFQGFVKDVLALGQPQRHLTDAQDVTEEWVDLETDIKNLKIKEAKLTDLMKDQAKSMSDDYMWEKDIYNVRGEIGRKTARAETLAKLTSLATVHVTLRDEKEYVAPAPPEPGTSVGRTFQASLTALENFGHFLLVALVALAPWSPLLIIFGLLVYKFRNVRIFGGRSSLADPEEA